MAYFNGFPATYPQIVPQYQMPQQNQQQSGINWVQGEQAAKAFLVAPNTTVQLWDSEEKVIYLKSADASGMPSMKVLEYTIRGETPEPTPAVPEYATKDQLAALEEKIRAIQEEISAKRKAKSAREDVDE